LRGRPNKEIAKEFDHTASNMEKCAKIVKLREAAGLAEPYSRLTEKPDHVPQWCSKHGEDDPRGIGGRHTSPNRVS
jgi:hypothetical protein